MFRPAFTRLAAACVVAVAVLAVAAPAGADDSLAGAAQSSATTTTTTAGASTTTAPSTTTPRAQQPATLSSQYQTLTAAMLSKWSTTQGASVSDVVGSDTATYSAAAGVDPTQLGELGVEGLLGSLDSQIARMAFGINGASTDFEQMSQNLPKVLATPDGASIAAGIMSARNVAQLDVPQLSSPGLLASSAPLSSIGPDTLAFGLFQNQSLVTLSQSAPDVFGAVFRQGGLTDPNSMAAWSEARSMTAQRLASGFETSMLNPCLAVMMSSAASGSTSGNPALSSDDGCRPCAVAGSYMGDYQGRLLTSGPQRLLIGEDGEVTDYEWWHMGEGSRENYIKFNPEYADELRNQASIGTPASPAGTSAAATCSDSLSGTANFLGDNLGGILSRLGG